MQVNYSSHAFSAPQTTCSELYHPLPFAWHRVQIVNCYAEYTKAAEDLEGAKEMFTESSGAGGDAEMKEMAREEVGVQTVPAN